MAASRASLWLPLGAAEPGRTLRALRLCRFVQSFTYAASFPYLALYLTEERRVRTSTIGVLYAALWIAIAAAQLVTVVGRYDLGRMIARSFCARVAVAVLLWGLITLRAPLLALAVALLLSALLAGLFPSSADGLVLLRTPPAERAVELSRQRVATQLGWIAGPAAGGLLLGHASMALLFLATGLPYLAAGALLSARRSGAAEASVRAAAPGAPPRPERSLVLHLVAALLTFCLAGQLSLLLALDATARLHVSKAQLGTLWTLSALLIVLAQVPAARLVHRLGPYRALISAALLSAVGYALIGLARGYGHLALCIVLIAAADVLSSPAQHAAASSGTTLAEAGWRTGVVSLLVTAGRSAGPVLGGVAHELCGQRPRLLWAVMGAVWVAAAALYGAAARRAPVRG